jgi:mono/diheme cytochrome c family protein
MEAVMKTIWILGGVVAALAAGSVRADDKVDPKVLGAGRGAFLRYCASCHGTDAKGGGPAAAALKAPVPDLTRLPPKDGKFDEDRARTFIDGTQAATAHGSREMPVWGKVLEKTGDKRSAGWAQAEVWTLVEYLRSIQVPPPAPK